MSRGVIFRCRYVFWEGWLACKQYHPERSPRRFMWKTELKDCVGALLTRLLLGPSAKTADPSTRLRLAQDAYLQKA